MMHGQTNIKLIKWYIGNVALYNVEIWTLRKVD